jgi:predicted metalloprotease with PDZ domain
MFEPLSDALKCREPKPGVASREVPATAQSHFVCLAAKETPASSLAVRPWSKRRRKASLSLLILVLLARVAFAKASSPISLQYHLILLRPSSHLIDVEIDAQDVQQPFLNFVMPAWSPGRYAIYNFAKNVQQFEATGINGQPLPWINTDKDTWKIDTETAGGTVKVRYRVFANDLSGTFSQFDPTHADINGASVYMYVAGHKRDPITLNIQPPSAWKKNLKIIDGFSDSTNQEILQAPNYDRLIDTPVEVCTDCVLTHFRDQDKLFRVAVHSYGEGGENTQQWTDNLTQGLEKIVNSEMAMMPEPDFKEYTFIFHVSPFISLGDGMEHLNSTSIVIRGLTSTETLSQAFELGAHEFFHLWNVKRLRPVGLGPFDYNREVYTRSLWFAEGVTTYYSYVALYRSGIWNQEELLGRLADEIRQLRNDPGRAMMSAESSSFHAWFYDGAPQLQKTNFANSTISYYNKGAILGMLLDLEIRERAGGRKSLDDVLRSMYKEFYQAPAATYYLPGRGYTEQDILAAVNQVSGSDFGPFFQKYIEGTEPLPYSKALGDAGLALDVAAAPGTAPSIGVVTAPVENGYRIVEVRPGGPADEAGLGRGDTLIEVDGLSLVPQGPEQMLKMYPAGAKVPFTVQRYGERKMIWVTLGEAAPDHYKIQINPAATPEELRIWEGWLARKPAQN